MRIKEEENTSAEQDQANIGREQQNHTHTHIQHQHVHIPQTSRNAGDCLAYLDSLRKNSRYWQNHKIHKQQDECLDELGGLVICVLIIMFSFVSSLNSEISCTSFASSLYLLSAAYWRQMCGTQKKVHAIGCANKEMARWKVDLEIASTKILKVTNLSRAQNQHCTNVCVNKSAQLAIK